MRVFYARTEDRRAGGTDCHVGAVILDDLAKPSTLTRDRARASTDDGLRPRRRVTSHFAIMIQNLAAFTAAAILEILGCFTFWLWLRRSASPAIASLGILSLIGFAVALTRVDAAFAGRAYAAYWHLHRCVSCLHVARRSSAANRDRHARCEYRHHWLSGAGEPTLGQSVPGARRLRERYALRFRYRSLSRIRIWCSS
jgi:drug/metabolite transporter superfamily protein YnfA